jgi:hypothetical protein
MKQSFGIRLTDLIPHPFTRWTEFALDQSQQHHGLTVPFALL